MEYYLNELDPAGFQRLINSILVAKYGEGLQLGPLRGKDGGRDAEIAPGSPFYSIQVDEATPPKHGLGAPIQPGRYLFQAKHHRTVDTSLTDARRVVIADFEQELKKNVLRLAEDGQTTYFFMITNVPASSDALEKIDEKCSELLEGRNDLHANVWWQEHVVVYLDQMPVLWKAFPEIFAGRSIPFLAEVLSETDGLPRTARIAITEQYRRDSVIKFRQIDLEKSLSKLFVDLDVSLQVSPTYKWQRATVDQLKHTNPRRYHAAATHNMLSAYRSRKGQGTSALGVLLSESPSIPQKIILEGGPGQGKSTITQMVAQIYRQHILGKDDMKPEGRWGALEKPRLPIRIELRSLGEWLTKQPDDSLESYLASSIGRESAGSSVRVDDIHTMVERCPILLILNGLDEVASDELRDTVLQKIVECVDRLEGALQADLRVILTTRPPAISGRRDQLPDFHRLVITPMTDERIEEYVERWLSVQVQDVEDRNRILSSFDSRKAEPHVGALAKNPMQLSVLLHFIRLKGEAFPDRRAELYREYFQTVIDRDVEKSTELRKHRETIEGLHQLLGYKIHALTESELADGTLSRDQLLDIVAEWLSAQGNEKETAAKFFKLGEERLGLIVTLKGEGQDTRYGYEVQPVREYFTAAYINEQISGNAHDVFQAMARRPYWREVALFLAGLRRPNEKADLVVRARALDDEEGLGWRQDGRSLTLQLLQEGVLTQPGHVRSQAVELLLDLFDPSSVNPQNEPKELSDQFPGLVLQGEPKRHLDRIEALAKKYRSSPDEHTLFRLYKLICRVFDEDRAGKILLDNQSESPRTRVKARCVWPSIWGMDLGGLASQPGFWDGISNEVWAEGLWSAGIAYSQAFKMNPPRGLHEHLVCQLAANPSSVAFGFGFDFEDDSTLAVWRLLRRLQVLELLIYESSDYVSLPPDLLEQLRGYALGLTEDGPRTDTAGLDHMSLTIVMDFLQVYDVALRSVLSADGSVIDDLRPFLKAIEKHLGCSGYQGWLACRCTRPILHAALVFGRKGTKRMFGLFRPGGEFGEIWNSFWPFYMEEAVQASNKEIRRFLRSSIAPGEAWDKTPRYVRLRPNGPMVPIVDLVVEAVRCGNELPFPWFAYMPINAEIIRPCVERLNGQLPDLLALFGRLRIANTHSDRGLRAGSIQRILKIARQTTDPLVIRGILQALSASSFLVTAGSELILKLLQGGPPANKSGRLLFQHPAIRKDDKSAAIMTEVAEVIVRNSDHYTFQLSAAAAGYLAERMPVSLPPILLEEESLGLQVRPHK